MCFLDVGVRNTIRGSINPHNNNVFFNTHQLTFEPASALVEIVCRYFHPLTGKLPKILDSNKWPVNTRRTYLERVRYLDRVRYVQNRAHQPAHSLAIFQIDASITVNHEPQHPSTVFANKLNLYEFGIVAVQHGRDFLPNPSLNLLRIHNT